jgi:RHS repeat-associated protein
VGVFINQTLQFIPTAEGRFLPNNTATTTQQTLAVNGGVIANSLAPRLLTGSYEYQLSDHLGNLRVACQCNATTGETVLTQENHYDPWGVNLSDIELVSEKTSDWWQFSGKEKDFLAYTEFRFRHYDPAIGRFLSIDPLADEFTFMNPFNYADNNPATFMDLYGLQAVAPASAITSATNRALTQTAQNLSASAIKTLTPAILNAGAKLINDAVVQQAPKVVPTKIGQKILEQSVTLGTRSLTFAFVMIPTSMGTGDVRLGNLSFDESDLMRELLNKKEMGIITAQELHDLLALQLNQLRPAMLPQSGSGSGEIKNTVTRSQSVLGHIFRTKEGHVNPSSIDSQNRYIKLFEDVANNPANFNSNVLSPAQRTIEGIEGFSKTFRNGQQIWVQTRNGKIFDAGINTIPK